MAIDTAGVRAWQRRFPERVKAHRSVLTALRNGTLFRPSICEDCGVSTVPIAHHANYNEPLAVRWLCDRCHATYRPKTAKQLREQTKNPDAVTLGRLGGRPRKR